MAMPLEGGSERGMADSNYQYIGEGFSWLI